MLKCVVIVACIGCSTTDPASPYKSQVPGKRGIKKLKKKKKQTNAIIHLRGNFRFS